MSSRPEIDLLFKRLGDLTPAGFAAGLHIRFAVPMVNMTTYNEEWVEHYTNNAYGLRDSMIAWGLSSEGHIRWSEIELPDPFDIMGQAAKYGLRYGVAVACGSIQSRTIVGAARSDREFEDDEIEKINALVLELHVKTDPPTELTKAQSQALRCIADGDRHAAAAAKLGISESALKARLSSARTRLMARTTSEAIQKAKEYRLL